MTAPLIERVHAHLAAHQLEAAAALLATVDEDEPTAWHARAVLAHLRGQSDESIRYLERAVHAFPHALGLQLALGQALVSAGRHADAESRLLRAVATHAAVPDAWYLLGMARYAAKDDEGAKVAFARAHALEPGAGEIRRALAEAHYALEEHADAVAHFDALPGHDEDVGLLLRRAQCRRQLGEIGVARELAVSATRLHPGVSPSWQELGRIEEDLGHTDEAREAYLRAHALDPRWADPLGSVIALMRETAPGALLASAAALVDDTNVPPSQRALLHYVLGKREDAQGQAAAAARHWGEANRLRREADGAFDRAAYSAQVDACIAAHDAEVLARLHDAALVDERPMFILGMPRSGTTLAEQVLAAHPEAWGCGERSAIAAIAEAIGPATGMRWPEDAAQLPAAWLRARAEAYLAAAPGAPPTARRLLDKQPYNFMYVGLIAALFANARVVWCRRDPRDIALSIWSESFSPRSTYATDLDDILFVIGEQERLMRHWQRVSPVPILEHVYEAVVEDPEARFRELVAFAGLAWEPACLEFHASGRSVQTMSRWQVRQPVYTRSVGRWKRYAALFDGLDAG